LPGMPAGERRLYKWRKPHESNMGAASAHCTGSADSLLSCWRLFFEQAAWRWAPLNCVVRFNSSTGSRTTLCGPPRILAGSIRFIGYNVPWQGFAPCMSGLPSYAHRAFLRPEKREHLSPNRLQGYRCHSTRHHSVYLFRHTVMSKCRS